MTKSLCGDETHTVCDACSRCRECDRTLNATPHLLVCACPQPHLEIDLCGDCRTKQTAYMLTKQRNDPPFFVQHDRRALSGEEGR